MSSPTRIGRFDSLAFRLTLSYAALSSLCLVAVLGVSYVIVERQLNAELARELEHEVVEYEAMLETRGVTVLQELLEYESKSEGYERAYYRLYTRDGEPIFHSDLAHWSDLEPDRAAIGQAAAGAPQFVTLPAADRNFPTRVLYSPLGDEHVIELGLVADEEGAVLQNYRRVFVMSSLMFVAFSFVLGSVMAHRSLRGVRRVTEAARSIAGGSWGLRVLVGPRRDEVADLAEAFNEMIHRIQKLINELREVTDDIAHDLRTPIARMRASAESCVQSTTASEGARELAGNVLEECDRLQQLINTMLDLSQMEAGAGQFSTESVDLCELAEDIFDLFKPAAEDKGIEIQLDTCAGLEVRGDRQRLMRAIAHIVDNAVKYTEPGGVIVMQCSRRNGTAVVSIEDSGVGIASSDIPRVFDRFYRGDRSRTGTGHGLGLSAARAICVVHGGSIVVESVPREGSTFEIRLPAG